MTITKNNKLNIEDSAIIKDEVPFKLPNNWCWVKLIELGKFGMGQTVLSKELKREGIPIYSASDDKNIFGYIDENANKIKLTKGDFVIAARGNIGTIKKIYQKAASCTQTTMYFKPYSKDISPYLYYTMNAFNKKLFISTGATIPQLTIKSLNDKLIPFAPINEQDRIVEKLDRLFEKLDTAKDLIQQSLDMFEDRKNAILHKAFSGELTAEWRKNYFNDENLYWKKTKLEDVCDKFQYGTSNKSSSTGSYIVLRMGNLQNGYIDFSDLVYTDNEEDIYKYRLHKGDVLFNRTNSAELVGKTAIYESDLPAIFAGYLIRIEYNKKLLNGRYLNYLLNSLEAKKYCMKVKSDAVNQSNINAKKIAAFTFKKPILEEQEEIVRILDSIFEKEDKTKELLDMIDKIDEMKKTILAKAFRGELNTNNPEDEPAEELVKRILASK